MYPPFQIGDTADVQINGKPAKVTWRDKDTLVINSDDVRQIDRYRSSSVLLMFFCTEKEEHNMVSL
jgi:hypothetical protein